MCAVREDMLQVLADDLVNVGVVDCAVDLLDLGDLWTVGGRDLVFDDPDLTMMAIVLVVLSGDRTDRGNRRSRGGGNTCGFVFLLLMLFAFAVRRHVWR